MFSLMFCFFLLLLLFFDCGLYWIEVVLVWLVGELVCVCCVVWFLCERFVVLL